MSVNKCILVGNLGKDAEVRATNSGMQVASLRVATADRKKDQSGQWVDHTEWHSVTCFDKLAALMERFGKKGKQLYIEGKLQTREYTDKEGNKRWMTEIVASDIRLLSGARDAESAPQAEPQTRRASPPKPAATKPAESKAPADDYAGYNTDDLPF